MKSWNKFYLHNEGMRYPDNYIISSVLRIYRNLNLSQRKKINILDLGFGAHAANTIFLCKENFNVYGVDISENALIKAKKILKKNKLKANLKQGDFSQLDYEDSFFDMVVDCRSLQHSNKSKIENIFFNISRILKSHGAGGIFLSIFSGYELNKTGFYTNNISKTYLQKLLKIYFNKYSLGYLEFSYDTLKKTNYYFIIKATKK